MDSNSQRGNVEECENTVVKVRRGRKRKQDIKGNIVEDLELSSVSKGTNIILLNNPTTVLFVFTSLSRRLALLV